MGVRTCNDMKETASAYYTRRHMNVSGMLVRQDGTAKEHTRRTRTMGLAVCDAATKRHNHCTRR